MFLFSELVIFLPLVPVFKYWRFSGFATNKGLSFFLKCPQTSKIFISAQCQTWWEPVSQTALWKSRVLDVYSTSFPCLPSIRETMNWTFTPNCSELCSLGEGATWVRNDGFSISFQHSLEHTLGAATSQLVSWVFIKAFGLYVIVQSVSLWESKVWDFLVRHLALQTNF